MTEIQNKTDIELTKELLEQMPDKYQKNVGYFVWDFFRAISKILLNLWEKLRYVNSIFFDIRNMNLEELALFVSQRRNIIWKDKTASKGELVVVKGGGIIQQGTIFRTANGIEFKATETKTVTEGDLFNVECTKKGIIGNVPANSIIEIPTTITGIVAVSNPNAFTNGYEAETKESLYNRYIEDLQNPITSGNIYHYKKWAKEVPGVGEADVKPLWQGDNTVKVILLDLNFEPASETLVKEVQKYIDPNISGRGEGQAPMGAYCTVTSASKLELNISFNLKIKTAENETSVKENISNSIKKYLKELAFSEIESYVSYAQIGKAILVADGVLDYSNLLINGGIDNITIPNNEADRSVAILKQLEVSIV